MLMRSIQVAARFGRKSLGLALVLAALAGQAQAVQSVPEIDPGSAMSALTLLSGGLLILVDRVRRRR